MSADNLKFLTSQLSKLIHLMGSVVIATFQFSLTYTMSEPFDVGHSLTQRY